MYETKEARFRRLAEARVNKIIAMLRLLGNCSRKENYQYSPEQIDRIFTRLQSELDRTHKRYRASMNHTRPFSLSETEETQEAPSMTISLPDGSVLTARATFDVSFPGMCIDLIPTDGEGRECVCFVEYNPEREEGEELCVGTYRVDSDDTSYYESYYDRKGIKGS